MSVRVPSLPCYLVEWYRPEITAVDLDETVARLDASAAMMSAAGAPVSLMMTLALPTDEVVFCVFSAGSAQFVADACCRAGFPPERLTQADGARIAGG
ncbi:hypothetical protein [Mycobacterium sp.]|uniref:hypothetical protein n=1 Tax=Mycobacterium sp. TaxID=1785 RepID=UPI002EE6DA46